MEAYDQPGTLYERTRTLLEKQDLFEVSKATGLPFYWLRSLPTTTNPSVNRVQVLYEYLTNKPLKV